MERKYKKRSLTLLEIMIVIFLIGLIGGAIGYNMKGSLNEGRAFRSERGAEQIKDILLLEVAKGSSVDHVIAHKEMYLEASGLVKDVKKLLKDGWGDPFEIRAIRGGSDILVRSAKLKAFQDKKKEKIASFEPDEEMNEDDTE